MIFLAWLAYVAIITRRPAVKAGNLPVLADLVGRLELERRYGEIVSVLQPHISLLTKADRRELWLQRLLDRVRAHGNPTPWRDLMDNGQEEAAGRWGSIGAKVNSGGLYALKPVAWLFPKFDKKEDAARRILRVVYTNERLVEFLARERPLVALEIMLNQKGYDYDFSDRALHYMISDRGGQLPREVMLNQNTNRCFFEIDPHNRIIHALFHDSKVAEKLEVYRPIGNYPLELLEENFANYRSIISASKPRKDETTFSDPTYVTIRFFDIMVRSSMRDRIDWHMWLFYMNLIVDKLVKHMSVDHPDYDADAEFPNFAHYLIYEIFSAYGSWLEATDCCDADSPAVRIQSTQPRHENGSILKSTILSMGQSMGHLVQSPKITDDFVTYILEVVLRDLNGLRAKRNGAMAAEALINSLLARGVYGQRADYGTRLRRCYDQTDHVIRFATQQFSDALDAAYP